MNKIMNPVMIFNPQVPNGSTIRGRFGGVDVVLPAGELRTFPYEAATQLLGRYPFLSLVKDHPTAAPDILPDSGIVEDAEPVDPPAEPIEPEVAPTEPESIPEGEETVDKVSVEDLSRLDKEELIETLEAHDVKVNKRLGVMKLAEQLAEILNA